MPVEGKLSSAVGQEAPVLGGEHTPELTPAFRQQELVGSGTSMIQAPSMNGQNTGEILEAEFCMVDFLCAPEAPYIIPPLGSPCVQSAHARDLYNHNTGSTRMKKSVQCLSLSSMLSRLPHQLLESFPQPRSAYISSTQDGYLRYSHSHLLCLTKCEQA